MKSTLGNKSLRYTRLSVRHSHICWLSWLSGLAATFLAIVGSAQGQGLETFDNSTASSSYADGSFTGEGGIEWSFVHSRNEGTYGIDGNGLMLRRSTEPSSLFANIPGGIGNFSVDTRKAFTGNAPRKIELIINGGVVAQFEPAFGEGADDTVLPFVVNNIDVAGTVALELRVFDDGAQITLDNLGWTGFGDGSAPPNIGNPAVSGLKDTEATLSATFFQNDGANFTEYGFVIAEIAVNAEPSVGDLDANTIDFAGTPASPIEATLTGLLPETDFAVRAYVIYDGGSETIYSASVTTFTTLAPPEPLPTLDGVTDYTQDFSAYVSEATLPTGWNITHGGDSDYNGDWGTGTSNGPRGNASVLGFQHTSSTGTAVKSLTLINDTGSELNEITVAYDGRVERASEGRSPAYTVFVNGVEIAALAYSTEEGDGVTKTASITGLGIAVGASFTIEWESTRGGPSGSSKQIGISNFVVATGSVALPPVVGPVTVDPATIIQTEFFASSSVLADNGEAVTSRGFVYAETALNAAPELGGVDVTEITLSSGLGSFDAFIDSLMPGTEYSIRAFAANSVGTAYSSTLVVETLGQFPLLGDTPYTQTFSGYDGTLPAGWQTVSSEGVTSFLGDWGSGASGGLRGNEIDPGVLGYQHAGGTGELVVTLTLVNDTGATIENLEIGYLGRVERIDQGRSPAWTVEVEFASIEALTYSTSIGVDEAKSALVTGLFIPDGATFSITWTSDNIGTGSGSSRQIGISDVSVAAVTGSFLSPVEIDPPSDTYLEAVTVSMFSFDPDIEIRYTLDGTTPNESSLLYTEDFAITETTTVQARAFPTDPLSSSEPSAVSVRNYVLPISVTELSEVKDPVLNQLYRIDAEVIVSHIDGGPFRNQAYLTDATGGVFIDDPAGNLDAPNNHALGDGISGLVGTFSVFSGQLQFTPDPSTGISTGLLNSTDNAIPTVSATLDELNTNFLDYRYRLVSIEGIVFDAGDGIATFGGGGSLLDVTDPSGNGQFYVFFSTDYIGAVIPEGSVDLLAIPHSRNDGNFFSVRSLADFSPGTPPSNPLGDYLALRSLTEADLESDTTGNGLTVLEEYFFGIGDGVGADSLRLSVLPDSSALTVLSDRASDPAGVVVELLATSDLSAGFTPVAFTVGSEDNDDGTHTRSYTETNPPAQATSRFYQLRLSVAQ